MDSSPFLIRVATDVEQIPSLAAAVQKIAGTKLAVFCGGGTIAWISAEDLLQIDALDASLNTLKCAGVVVRGRVDGLRVLGRKEWVSAARRIQSAIDPNGRFASY